MSVIIHAIFDEASRRSVAPGAVITSEQWPSLRSNQVVIKNHRVAVDDRQQGGALPPADWNDEEIIDNTFMDLSLLSMACQDVVDAQDWIHNHSYLRFHLTVLMDHMGWVYTHSLNVAILTVMVALRLGIERSQRLELAAGALLHDVGTLFIPPDMLNKPAQLTNDERVTINRHASLGERMLTRKGIPQRIACIAGQHHERWDGHGHPRQLKGPDIDLGAQIVAVADVFDALTSTRPHRASVTLAEAKRIMIQKKNVDFNGIMVSLLFGKRE